MLGLQPDLMRLLPSTHSMLARPFMLYRPFGVDDQGNKIRDISGVTVVANLPYLEKSFGQREGTSARTAVAEELFHILNARIQDPVYRATPAFLRNQWHSHSYEFGC